LGLEVIESFDDMGRERRCILGKGACSDVDKCRAHQDWLAASGSVYRFFETRTLADLMKRRT